MITARDDYLSLLYQIQDPNRKNDIIPNQGRKLTEEEFKQGTYYCIVNDKYVQAKTYDANTKYYNEPIYDIDLDTRKIDAPKMLSVEYDHNAETIYFRVDRFFDNVDLSTMFCVVQYQNANPDKSRGGFIYPVPYFDTTTEANANKLLFQWAIEGPATAYSGKVTFSIKFYKITSTSIQQADGSVNELKTYEYVLNTVPSTSEVLHGLDILATSENYYFEASEIDKIYQEIEQVRRTNDLYWTILTVDDIPETVSDYPNNTINKNNIITNLITE